MALNAIVPIQQGVVGIARPQVHSNEVIESSWRLAQYAAQSGLAKTKSPYDAFFIIMYGLELGVSQMASLRMIYSVNGVPTCSGELMLALIRKSGLAEKIDMSECSATAGIVTMKRRDTGDEHIARFTIDNAKQADLMGKDNWKKFPSRMLMWRAVSECAKVLFSDVVGGLYTLEEIAPDTRVDEQGAPIGEIVVIETPTPKLEVVKSEPEVSEGEVVIEDTPANVDTETGEIVKTVPDSVMDEAWMMAFADGIPDRATFDDIVALFYDDLRKNSTAKYISGRAVGTYKAKQAAHEEAT